MTTKGRRQRQEQRQQQQQQQIPFGDDNKKDNGIVDG
jgi:hypothetical protein